MLTATKIRIYPSKEQEDFLYAQFGAVRFCYNKSLHIKRHFYKKKGVSLSPKKDLKPLLAVAKKTSRYSWLKQYDSIALQQSVLHLQEAFSKFFDQNLPNRFPRFKSKRSQQSSYHCMGVKVSQGKIKLPKLDWIKAKVHREVKGEVKSITVSCTPTGKFYASILSKQEGKVPEKLTHFSETKVLGLDVGITDFYSDSNHLKVGNPRFLNRAYQNLRKKQKSLSRKKKGSGSWKKARLLVSKCHERVTFARNDFQHKLSHRITDENQAVIVEGLKIKNMLKNSKLSKAISDVAWGNFLTKLEYKCERKGKYYLSLDTFFPSSKLCSSCGYKREKLSLSTRSWTCPQCGTKHDRDTKAAKNIKLQGIIKIKADGHAVSANGGLRKTLATRAVTNEVRSLA